jgi:hypothetical protein
MQLIDTILPARDSIQHRQGRASLGRHHRDQCGAFGAPNRLIGI